MHGWQAIAARPRFVSPVMHRHRARCRALVTCLIVVIAVTCSACAGNTKRFELAPEAMDGRQVIYVDLHKEPQLLTPWTAGAGLVGGMALGAVEGIIEDCLIFMCVPLATTIYAAAGAVGGVATSDSSANVRTIEELLAAIDIPSVLPDLLRDRVIEQTDEATAYLLVRLDALSPADARAVRAKGRLTLDRLAAGLLKGGTRDQYTFVLVARGTVGMQATAAIRYTSEGHDLDYWAESNGANLTKSMIMGVDNVARELVQAVFVPASRSENQDPANQDRK